MKQFLKIFLILLIYFWFNQPVLAAGDFGCKFTRGGCTPDFDTDTCDATSQVDYNYCPQFTSQGAQACNSAPRKSCISVGSCADLGGTCTLVGPLGCPNNGISKGHLDCPGAGDVCCVPAANGDAGGNIGDTLIKLDDLIREGVGGKIPQMTDLGTIISNALPLLFGITGFALFLFLIFSGFKYLTSAGDPKKLEAAKGALTTAILGFVLIFTAYWITQIVNYIFNLQAGF